MVKIKAIWHILISEHWSLWTDHCVIGNALPTEDYYETVEALRSQFKEEE